MAYLLETNRVLVNFAKLIQLLLAHPHARCPTVI
jgi:hypothetical protein